MSRAFVSIIIVNFNGHNLLRECLSSLFAISYPKEKFEVILVDNNSTDNSVRLVKREFPQVRLIESNVNLGFTGGNRLGLTYAKGEYIVLLNTDTVVDRKWLDALVEAAEDRTVGIVNSKLYFATPFIPLHIHSDVVGKNEISDTADFSPMGVLVEPVICETEELTSLVWYQSGFYEKGKGEIPMRWTRGDAQLLVPFAGVSKKDSATYTIALHGYPAHGSSSTAVTISLGKQELVSDALSPNQVKQFQITIDRKQAKQRFVWLIQNAGNIILADGHGKDRGSVVIRTKSDLQELYEVDSPFFNTKARLLSACGASCLIKKQVIRDVGFFDPDFYMYYEDQDFSVRAWRAGWEIAYEPSSVVYHKHRATTGKSASTFFLYHVEKNHLVFLLKHFPESTFRMQFLLFLTRLTWTALKMTAFGFRDNLPLYNMWRTRYEGRWGSLVFILKEYRSLRSKREQIEKQSVRGYNEMIPYLY